MNAAPIPPRRVWPWVALALLAALLLLAFGGAVALAELIDGARSGGLQISIDGERWDPGIRLDGDNAIAFVLAAGLLLFALLMLLPLLLLVIVVAVVFALAASLLAMVIVAAVALSPLWLTGLLLWLLLRPRRAPAATSIAA